MIQKPSTLGIHTLKSQPNKQITEPQTLIMIIKYDRIIHVIHTVYYCTIALFLIQKALFPVGFLNVPPLLFTVGLRGENNAENYKEQVENSDWVTCTPPPERVLLV